ncbi:hypothetical protein C8Q74DRAFT_1222755 [Fomes fomentarius]|nr:hypothetical protein C8Q74DRAFT_1222755 [Fomes fomentarius]
MSLTPIKPGTASGSSALGCINPGWNGCYVTPHSTVPGSESFNPCLHTPVLCPPFAVVVAHENNQALTQNCPINLENLNPLLVTEDGHSHVLWDNTWSLAAASNPPPPDPEPVVPAPLPPWPDSPSEADVPGLQDLTVSDDMDVNELLPDKGKQVQRDVHEPRPDKGKQVDRGRPSGRRGWGRHSTFGPQPPPDLTTYDLDMATNELPDYWGLSPVSCCDCAHRQAQCKINLAHSASCSCRSCTLAGDRAVIIAPDTDHEGDADESDEQAGGGETMLTIRIPARSNWPEPGKQGDPNKADPSSLTSMLLLPPPPAGPLPDAPLPPSSEEVKLPPAGQASGHWLQILSVESSMVGIINTIVEESLHAQQEAQHCDLMEAIRTIYEGQQQIRSLLSAHSARLDVLEERLGLRPPLGTPIRENLEPSSPAVRSRSYPDWASSEPEAPQPSHPLFFPSLPTSASMGPPPAPPASASMDPPLRHDLFPEVMSMDLAQLLGEAGDPDQDKMAID